MTPETIQYKSPGQLLEGLLRERGWTKRTLAVVLGMDEAKVGRYATDRQPVTADVALLLEDVFGVDASVFLALQCSFDIAKARIVAQPDPKRKTRAAIHQGLPLSDMIKRGWINAKDVRDPTLEDEIVRFFGTNKVEDIEILPHSAKKTEVSEPATPVQIAWLYRVRKIAHEMLVARYSHDGLATAVAKLKALLISPEAARKVPRILAEAGVRFLVVESLPGAKIDGVCFWLNNHSPVIAMTMRFDRVDNFWFVLRHEIEHVLQGHGRDKEKFMLDVELAGDNSASAEIAEEERIANEAAADFCVPKKMMDAFVARKAPFFHDRDILAFAKMINVHPGLIAGQIRHRTNNYTRFQNYLEKIRSVVLPNAVVDGWGSVYPVEL
ncbi:HTH-type transcriptional regulator / antitoxin HigA [Rhodoblastus acidophilus]|uniref:HTH-type transcriptional regulator / antitoxin HigA n=1 Tax=Rhodoblastus acidophilus TaxID=1074 RepID=A0A212SDJ3_RHOAC|nr:ImmA/IrrE family metallo-endopeptidase [Rhodoblastus acidophilus]RAI16842.1 ImmA/IrrE family metallo-endopeptidase [Rhodoblastus acidophilus]SNB83692.1 HTH-type transcriptional regulator / antitoxin HigA [Rhodoblastus acidophilus]